FILNIFLMLGVSKMTFTSMMLFLYSITSEYLCLVYHLMLSLGRYSEFLLQPSILMTRISLHQNIFLIHHQGITDISKLSLKGKSHSTIYFSKYFTETLRHHTYMYNNENIQIYHVRIYGVSSTVSTLMTTRIKHYIIWVGTFMTELGE
ncbi:hypothetical protein ACJX0J_033538, partial [Zea mays]